MSERFQSSVRFYINGYAYFSQPWFVWLDSKRANDYEASCIFQLTVVLISAEKALEKGESDFVPAINFIPDGRAFARIRTFWY